jgi:5-methylcytosine-specific restriction endonuclease McrA
VRQLLTDNPLCCYCRSPLSFESMLDHKTPTSRGGKHALANLAVCCRKCNTMKGLADEKDPLVQPSDRGARADWLFPGDWHEAQIEWFGVLAARKSPRPFIG